jgi:hypothetical protein
MEAADLLHRKTDIRHAFSLQVFSARTHLAS